MRVAIKIEKGMILLDMISQELSDDFKILEIDEKYSDCQPCDFNIDTLTFNEKKYKARKELEEKQSRIPVIQSRLDQLSQDIVQDMAGEVVPDIEERKAEFIELHNTLRVLLGKTPREEKVTEDNLPEENNNASNSIDSV